MSEKTITNFEKWKAEMTIERAKEINGQMRYVGDDLDDGYEELPTNDKDLKAWRKANNLSLDDVGNLFELADCPGCPIEGTGIDCGDSCFETIADWGMGVDG